MHRYIYAAAAALALACANEQPPDDQFSQGVDLNALRQAARTFTRTTGSAGGSLTLATYAAPQTLNPITATDEISREMISRLYCGLVAVDGATGLPRPALARRWEQSADGLVWTFFLRDSLVWSDGAPLQADDIVFTFDSLLYNDSIEPNIGPSLFMVDGRRIAVEAVDSLIVRFTLPAPFAPFLKTMTQEILPRHIYANQANTFADELSAATPAAAITASGPFMLESLIPSRRVRFVRNPRYWATDAKGTPLPYLDTLTYLIVADADARVRAFLGGETDYLSAGGEEYERLQKRRSEGDYRVYRMGPSPGCNFLVFNQRPPRGDSGLGNVFRNVEFRRAVAHALNKKRILTEAFSGYGYPQWGPVSPSAGHFYNPDVKKWPYDTLAAHKKLRLAGLEDRDGDGYVETAEGVTVAFTILTNAGNTARVNTGALIQRDLERIGLHVTIRELDFSALHTTLLQPPFAWDAALIGFSGVSDPHFARDVWHSAGPLHIWNPAAKSTVAWERKIDSLFAAGAREQDIGKRTRLYYRWQNIAARQLPLIYTVLDERVFCIHSRFKNINPSVHAGLLHNLEYVYVQDHESDSAYAGAQTNANKKASTDAYL